MTSPKAQRTFPELLRDIMSNLEQMVRSELLLAKNELREEAAESANPGAVAGMGLLIGICAFGFLLLTAMYGLAMIMATWLAALLLGAILTILGCIFLASSVAGLKRWDPTIDKTMRSLDENVQWARDLINKTGRAEKGRG